MRGTEDVPVLVKFAMGTVSGELNKHSGHSDKCGASVKYFTGGRSVEFVAAVKIS